MRLKVQVMVRLLLLSLAAVVLVLAPVRLGAIVPENAFTVRVPFVQRSTSDLTRPQKLPAVKAQLMTSQAQMPASNAAPPAAPRQEYAPADPTNYGQRFATDIYGRPVSNALIIVIHETVGSASSAINLFQTPHPRDADQVSYHSLIKRDGTIVYIVPPEMRAFGAANSVFDGANGAETVRTNAAFPPSVNNFAYHTSLESPSDGRGNSRRHSGYTDAQYRSLAWLIARTHVPDERITTHQAVDRSGRRMDPRSFDMQRFLALLHADPERNVYPG
jgi:hypothetical protein